MMKARRYDSRFLTRKDDDGNPDIPQPHVYAIEESNGFNKTQLSYFGVDLNELEKNNAINQAKGLIEDLDDAKEYGSIINVDGYDWDLFRRFAEKFEISGQIDLNSIGIEGTQEKLNKLIDTGEVLAQKYHVVVTNPPYMGSSNMDSKLNEFVKKYYLDSKSDLFAVFIERCGSMTVKNGYQAMITQHA
ncbi:MAG: BREX-1 system adenine-specific DNA-methyltransferase PglX [Clostridiales bacterium]|nr:BREX-1 system adenine-specific DNA-methyltransferase PglX [Clostridiales bacterium]